MDHGDRAEDFYRWMIPVSQAGQVWPSLQAPATAGPWREEKTHAHHERSEKCGACNLEPRT